jgi:hypothetical protein
MDPTRHIEYLTGFLMGITFGLILECIIGFIYFLFCLWLRCTRPGLTWWWILVPVPLLLGIIMAKVIAGLHLGDQ